MKTGIIQFGEGNFLRAFIADIFPEKRFYINVVQPLENGMLEQLAKNDYKYYLHVSEVIGNDDFSYFKEINIIKDGVNPYIDFDKFCSFCLDENLQIVVSNTTESGIQYVEEKYLENEIMSSFPGKILQLLRLRFDHNLAPLDFLPVELIEDNAKVLKEIVIKKAQENKMSEEFIDYINTCGFYNTLVDRIVTGFRVESKDELLQKEGFVDNNIVKCEPYNKWVINALDNELDYLRELDIQFTDSIDEFREIKVKILNGTHTAIVPIGMIHNIEYVHELYENDYVSDYLKNLQAEIVSTISNGTKDQFVINVNKRFINASLNHRLEDIALNAVDKFITRNYPSLLSYYLSNKELPKYLTLSLSAIYFQYTNGLFTNDNNHASLWSNPSVELFVKTLFSDFPNQELLVEEIKNNQQIIKELYDNAKSAR